MTLKALGVKACYCKTSSESTAKAWLDEGGCQLAKILLKLRLKYARITWDGCHKPLKILASMSETDEVKPAAPEILNPVFSSNWGLDFHSLKILERIQSFLKPMSFTDSEPDAQEWVNLPLSEMLEMPPTQATTLNMKDYWKEDALDYVKRILKQQSVFNHSYEALLPYSPAQFTSTFEVVEFGHSKRLKRLVTIHHYAAISELASTF